MKSLDKIKVLWLLGNTEKKSLKDIEDFNPDHLISFGYRHIITPDIIHKYKIINVHIAFLPWNRGADPNFWSAYLNTPCGVTIHIIDEGVDTGDILVQKEMFFPDEMTLRQTYDRLVREGWHLLFTNFEAILKGTLIPWKQPRYHSVKDGRELIKRLPFGWDTSLGYVRKMKEV